MINDKTRELTSSLMDEEVQIEDAHILNQVADDVELRQKWQRYHLISDCLKSHLPETVSLDLHEKVSAAVANEPAILVPKQKAPVSYLKPVAGFAIAASVTVAVLLGVQTFQAKPGDEQLSNGGIAANTQIQNTSPVTATAPAQLVSLGDKDDSGDQSAVSRQAQERMNRYLMNYNEIRANNGVRGVTPHARMIGHEAK